MKIRIKEADIAETINKSITMFQRFSDTYKNIVYVNFDKIFSKKGISQFFYMTIIELIFFYIAIGNVKIDKEIEVFYRLVNASISSIVSLKNKITS